MTQLILDVGGYAIALPESQKGGYTAYEDDLSVDIEMIPGNLTKELRGRVWRTAYQYGWFNDDDRTRVIAACRKGKREPILCDFLVPERNETIISTFYVTNFKEPKFMWSSGGKPMWVDFSVELREVRPHD